MRYTYVIKKYPIGLPIRMGAAYGKVMGYATKDNRFSGTIKVSFDCEPRSIVTIEPEDMILIEKAVPGDRLMADITRPPIPLPSDVPQEMIKRDPDEEYVGLSIKEVLNLLPSRASQIRYLRRRGMSYLAIRNWTGASYRVIRNTCILNKKDWRPALLDHLPNGFQGYRLNSVSRYGYMTCRECRLVFRIENMYRMPMKDNPKVILKCCPKCGECDYVQELTDKDALIPIRAGEKPHKLRRIGDTYL